MERNVARGRGNEVPVILFAAVALTGLAVFVADCLR